MQTNKRIKNKVASARKVKSKSNNPPFKKKVTEKVINLDNNFN